NRLGGALLVCNSQRRPVVVAEVEFREISAHCENTRRLTGPSEPRRGSSISSFCNRFLERFLVHVARIYFQADDKSWSALKIEGIRLGYIANDDCIDLATVLLIGRMQLSRIKSNLDTSGNLLLRGAH